MTPLGNNIIITLTAAFHIGESSAFTPTLPTSLHRLQPSTLLPQPLSAKTDNTVEITFPTPQEAASAGIREWPQTYHKSSWSESVSEGQIATRYVLDGKGRVTINYYDEGGREALRKDRVYPGTLVEVEGEARLNWEVDGENGMIVLTPGFEEGGKLVLVLGFFVVFCAGLLAGSGGV